MKSNKCQYWGNDSEVRFLLNLIYNRKPDNQFSNLDISKLVRLIELHKILPFIFLKFKKYGVVVPPETASYLKNQYLFSLKRNLCFWREFLNIVDIFYQRKIAMVPIKGIDILVRFYPSFDIRDMCDIDILVKEEELTLVEGALKELGYQKKLYGLKEEYWRKKQCHIAFWKESISVEVHWGLDFKRKVTILPNLWERTKEILIQNYKIRVLSEEDALFSLALHLRHFGNILALKRVLDAANIINQAPNFNWNYVLEESKKGRMQAAIYFILMQVKLFTKTDIPEYILNSLIIPRWQKKFIKEFILKNSFHITPSLKKNYLIAHLLLYDCIVEPIWYLINIPYEQFCKFYNLQPYTNKANVLYNIWFLYMPIKLIFCPKQQEEFLLAVIVILYLAHIFIPCLPLPY